MKTARLQTIARRLIGWNGLLGLAPVLWLNVPNGSGVILEAPFTRITEGLIATESFGSNCVAWGDYNGDGWLDLFVGNHEVSNSLFRNNLDGSFTKVTTGPIARTRLGANHAAAWGDYDGDGWLDLALADLASATPGVYLFRSLGGGEHVRATSAEAGSLVDDLGRAVSVSWADYDQDGDLDLFVGKGAWAVRSRDSIYRNNGDRSFTAITNSPVVMGSLPTTQGAWCDFDNDGDLDLFVTHAGGHPNALFRNDKNGEFVDVAATAGVTRGGDSNGAAWGDFDNDGDMDLFVTNSGILLDKDTRNFLYRNRGDGTFEWIQTGDIAEDLGQFVSCAWVDFDNDGWLDLFVTAVAGGNRLYRNEGGGVTFTKVKQGPLVTDIAFASGCTWGDYNNDGFPDVFVANGAIFASEPNGLYRNQANGNSWIKLRCVGPPGNRSGFGTKVRVKATIGGSERWQTRSIVGSEGWLSFNSLDVLVGLGDATVVDILRIEWPSGRIQEWVNVPVKQARTVEHDKPVEIERQGVDGFGVTVRGRPEQRWRLEASSNLKHWSVLSSGVTADSSGLVSFKHTKAVNEPYLFFRPVAE